MFTNNSRPRVSRAGAALMLLVLAGLAPQASARCYFNESTANTLTETIVFSSAEYMRDTAVGTKTTQYSNGGVAWGVLKCDWSNYPMKSTATVIGGELVPGYTNVYKTGVDGIGIRFFGVAYGYANTREAPFQMEASSTGGSTSFKAAAQLIVTGQIGGGTITTLPSLRIEYKQGPYESQIYTATIVSPITIVSKSCRVANSSLQVNLPTILANKVESPGATAGDTNFSIELFDCPAGVSVYAAMNDASNPANLTSILTLASESTATGFGYQILFGGQPIKFGPNSAEPGTLNQFFVGKPSTATLGVPLTVRYVRTAAPAKSGSVIGKVVFNMSYQ